MFSEIKKLPKQKKNLTKNNHKQKFCTKKKFSKKKLENISTNKQQFRKKFPK